MTALLETMAANAILAAILALIIFGVTRFVKKPAAVYWLWMLVLLKLVTPPLVQVPLKLEIAQKSNDEAATVTPSLEKFPATQQAVFPVAEASGNLTGILPVDIPNEAFAIPKLPVEKIDKPEAELFVEEYVFSPAVTPDESPTNTLRKRPRRWSWNFLVGSIWLIGAGFWFALAAFRIFRFERFIRQTVPASQRLQSEAQELARCFGLRQCPQVLLVEGRVPPLLWSVGRPPVVVLPMELLDKLKPAEQVMLLAHELAHFRRRDHWFRWFEMLILGLYWWHPVVWWARRQLQQAEEQCCDAWVLWAFPEQAKDYAHALLSTVEFLSVSRSALPNMASGFGTINKVKRRFEMILENNISRRTSGPVRFGLFLFGCLALSLSVRIIQADARQAVSEKTAQSESETKTNTVSDTNESSLPESDSNTSALQTEHKKLLKHMDELVKTLNEDMKHSKVLKDISELVKALNEDKQHKLRAKRQKEAVAELSKLTIYVWQYEPNHLGKLNRRLPAPIRDGFRKALGGDVFSGPSAISINKPLSNEKFQNVLERLKSFPLLKKISYLGGMLRPEQIAKLKSDLPKVKIEPNPNFGYIGNNSNGFSNSSRLQSRSVSRPVVARIGPDGVAFEIIASPVSRSVKDQALQALIMALKDKDSRVRQGAALSLAKIGRSSIEVISAFDDLLRESDDPIMRKTAFVMFFTILPSEKRVPLLVNALKDQNIDLRRTALSALDHTNPHSPEIVTLLFEIIKKERNATVRDSAFRIVEKMKPASDEEVLIFLKALKDEEPKVRALAASALGKIKRRASVGTPSSRSK